VPFCPPGRIDCLNVRTSDNQILTACVLFSSTFPSDATALHAQTLSFVLLMMQLCVHSSLGRRALPHSWGAESHCKGLLCARSRAGCGCPRWSGQPGCSFSAYSGTRLQSTAHAWCACLAARSYGLGTHPPSALQPAPGAQDMPNVWIKPPPLPVGGIKQLWHAPSARWAARTLRE